MVNRHPDIVSGVESGNKNIEGMSEKHFSYQEKNPVMKNAFCLKMDMLY